jgi:glycosyltransferase involved in cell wall biosynthesis
MVSSPKGARYPWFVKSMQSFLDQTYESRELVILLNRLSTQEKKRALREIEKRGVKNVRVQYIAGKPSLGKLRNLSVKAASGDILCQWDDDDISDPLRLEKQSAILKNRSGVVYLQDAFQFLAPQRKIFWVNWKKYTKASGLPAGIPQTILFTKDIKVKFPESGKTSQRGEDLALYKVLRKKIPTKIHFFSTAYPLYTYVYHGENTWDAYHHFRSGVMNSVAKAKLLKNKKHICAKIKSLELDKKELDVLCKSGPLYKVKP